jgi:hypothetical protein
MPITPITPITPVTDNDNTTRIRILQSVMER